MDKLETIFCKEFECTPENLQLHITLNPDKERLFSVARTYAEGLSLQKQIDLLKELRSTCITCEHEEDVIREDDLISKQFELESRLQSLQKQETK